MSLPEWRTPLVYSALSADVAYAEARHYAKQRYHDTGDLEAFDYVEVEIEVLGGKCLCLRNAEDFASCGYSLGEFLQEWENLPPGTLSEGQRVMREALDHNRFMAEDDRFDEVICALLVPSARKPSAHNLIIIRDDVTQSAGLVLKKVKAQSITLLP